MSADLQRRTLVQGRITKEITRRRGKRLQAAGLRQIRAGRITEIVQHHILIVNLDEPDIVERRTEIPKTSATRAS